MKRSEFLDWLGGIIQNSPAYSAPVDHYLDGEAMAIEILEFLEEQGFQPPPRLRTDYEKANPTFDSINMWDYVRAWEPEGIGLTEHKTHTTHNKDCPYCNSDAE